MSKGSWFKCLKYWSEWCHWGGEHKIKDSNWVQTHSHVGYPPYLRPETCYFNIPTTKRRARQQSPRCSEMDRTRGRSDAHFDAHHSSFGLGRYFRISLISCSTTGFLIILPHFLYLDIYMVLCLILYISPSILARFNSPNIFISLGISTVVEIV